MDRRTTPFSGRVAHVSLRGKVDATFTEGERALVVAPFADLLSRPGGSRHRQLLMGASVKIIDREADHVFVLARRDGYCGWLAADCVGIKPEPTHWVASPSTHAYPEPRVQAKENFALSCGAGVSVTGTSGIWAETCAGFVPVSHLRRIGDWAADAVTVAETFLGSPYLWGGNTWAGLDCSGLVQVSLHASGRPCPGDSDQQQALGRDIAADDPLQRGDLLFWKGHVALMVDTVGMIHANGHTMSVANEDAAEAVARIAAQGGGPVTARRRL